MKKLLFVFLAVLLLLPATAFAQKQVASWLTLGGDYQARYDYLYGKSAPYYTAGNGAKAAFGEAFSSTDAQRYKQDSLITNRFRISMAAKPLRFVNVKARLSMYKVSGADSGSAIEQGAGNGGGGFFMDRFGQMDGTLGRVPGSDYVNVDYAYATWFNIADTPTWFSIGRRPSAGGIPGNLRRNVIKTGTSGTPNLLVDYVFDGISIGWAPYIAQLPGFYVKACAGQGFNAGYSNLSNTDFVGIFIAPYETRRLSFIVQWDRGMNIFDAPPDLTLPTNDTSGIQEVLQPKTNVGNIDWYGGVANGQIHNFNYFLAGALSHAMPNGQGAAAFDPFIEQALDQASPGTFVDPATGFPRPVSSLSAANQAAVKGFEPKMLDGHDHYGWAVYLGGRYDFPATRTKIGAEYNHGSADWIGFVPANDDMWTAKLGVRGNVYEVYAIQELHNKAIDKIANAFFRLGYQYYDIQNTGSNDWLTAPVAMDNLLSSPNNAQFFTPIRSAQDLYLTFNVQF